MAGSDYTSVSGSGEFTPGQTSVYITVPILDDTLDEANETLTVNITAGTNSTLTDGSGTGTILDNDTAPLPDPNPTPVAGDELAESLEGYTWRTVTDHNYQDSLQASWGTGQIAPVYATGGNDFVTGDYRQICGANQIAYNDHILYNGIPGKSHLHDFNGNKGVNASSTFDLLLGSGESSCNDRPGTGHAVQRSSYWMPALLDGEGHVVRYDLASLYYKRLPASSIHCGYPTPPTSSDRSTWRVGICTEIPNGLKMITGSKMVAGQYGPLNYEVWGVPWDFNCYEAADGRTGTYQNLAELSAGSPQCTKMDIRVNFPDCWNGTHLWKTDRSHVVYPYDTHWGFEQCPTTHPYLITGLQVAYFYTLTGLDLSKLKLASDYMNPSQPPGWSLHSDAHIVWDARVKRMMHDGCINGRRNCSGGDLGNGLQLKGAQQPTYGWTNPNRLEAEPPMPPNMVMP
jgi:hypothetical protein